MQSKYARRAFALGSGQVLWIGLAAGLLGCSVGEPSTGPDPLEGDDSAADGAEGPIASSAGYAAVADEPSELVPPGAASLAPSSALPGWRAMAPFSTTGDDPPVSHATVWTGTQMLIWGGVVWDQRHWTQDGPVGVFQSNRGYAYDVLTDSWSKLPPAPLSAHQPPLAVWTGKRMYIWGPYSSTDPAEAASYTPATHSWYKLPPPPSRMAAGAEMVWSSPPGQPGRLLIWGASTCSTVNGTGLRYRPSTHTWSWMRKSPLQTRQGHRMLWTGNRMLVWGGYPCGRPDLQLKDGASYDPVTNTWELLPAPPATLHERKEHLLAWGAPSYAKAFVFGGVYDESIYTRVLRDGGAYDPETRRWSLIAPPPDSIVYPPRRSATMFWAGDRIWIWGGWRWEYQLEQDLDSGATYSPEAGWAQIPSGGPSARQAAIGVWTGSEAILWGGEMDTPKGLRPLGDGKIFKP